MRLLFYLIVMDGVIYSWFLDVVCGLGWEFFRFWGIYLVLCYVYMGVFGNGEMKCVICFYFIIRGWNIVVYYVEMVGKI